MKKTENKEKIINEVGVANLAKLPVFLSTSSQTGEYETIPIAHSNRYNGNIVVKTTTDKPISKILIQLDDTEF